MKLDIKVAETLEKLHKEAEKDVRKVFPRLIVNLFRKISPHKVHDIYYPFSKEQGFYIYSLILDKKIKNVVEFGTSFGVSTIYMASALKITQGKVTTTEIVKSKCKEALRNFNVCGLNDYINLLEGDVLETLKDYSQPIDLLILDGWKEMYYDVFKMLEVNFIDNTIIFVDNTNFKDVKLFITKIKKHHVNCKIEKINFSHDNACLITYTKK